MPQAPRLPDYEDTYVHGATVGALTHFLNAAIPFVWIIGHMPNTIVEWWQTDVPLNAVGARITADVRLISYDLQLSTAEFFANAAAFEEHGITLVQSRQRMPDTLNLERIPEAQMAAVLKLNGAFLYIHLPHAAETALVRCFEPGYLGQFREA